MIPNNPKTQQQKKLVALCKSLPQGLPKPPAELIDFAYNMKKLKELKQKAQSCQNLQQRERLKENQKKFTTIIMENYKKALLDTDKIHTKAIVDLKHIIEKVEKLKELRDRKE